MIAVVPAAVLALVAASELWSALRYEAGAATPADWERVRGLFESHYRPGELIVTAPSWLDPVGRLHLGQWMDIDAVARADAARYSVIWEVAQGDHRAPEVDDLEATSTWQHGELTVRRFEQTPVAVVYDFARHLGEADVRGQAVGRPALVLDEVGFAPHRCVRVEARPGQEVELTFPRATLGSKLVVHAGLADVFTRRDIRSPADLRVEIDGKVVVDRRIGIDDGWVAVEAATTPGAAQVRFVVGARQPRRLLCFVAEARR